MSYEERIKNRSNDWYYYKCISQYHFILKSEAANRRYKEEISRLNKLIEQQQQKLYDLEYEIFDLKDTIQNKNDCIGAYECIIEDRDKRIDKAIKYCEESSKTIKSEYFSDVLNILKEK